MKNPFTKSGIAAIETEIANLAGRHETLARRRTDAGSKLEAAKSARRSALAGDPTADLSALNRDVREVEDEIETLDGVLGDLSDQRRDAESRLDGAKDADVRKAAAKSLTDTAAKFDAGAAELAQAVDAVAKATRRMMVSLPDTLQIVRFDEPPATGQTEVERIVATIVAEGLASAVPSLIPVRAWGSRGGHGHVATLGRAFRLTSDRIATDAANADLELASPLDTQAAARVVVSDRLRQRADAIVAGELSPDLTDIPAETDRPASERRHETVAIIPLKHIRFVEDEIGSERIMRANVSGAVPEPVANVAIDAGLALRIDTEEGTRALDKARHERGLLHQMHGQRPQAVVTAADCVDLGDPMGFRTAIEAGGEVVAA